VYELLLLFEKEDEVKGRDRSVASALFSEQCELADRLRQTLMQGSGEEEDGRSLQFL